jgi:hypothetical protein
VICTDGENPQVLIQGTDGNFYGTTAVGGPNPAGTPAWDPTFWAFGAGTIFKLTPKGKLTTLYNFCVHVSAGECTDGQIPTSLVQANDGNLYGETAFGGGGFEQSKEGGPGPLSAEGTVFKLTLPGTLTTLHDFCSQPGDSLSSGCTDGYDPITLMQATNGHFYGGAASWFQDNVFQQGGDIFRLSDGLKSFVEMLPTSGPVGAEVRITGVDLTGATSVSFNGIVVPNFTVASRHLITTTVPAGATSGIVRVVTPGGTLESNVPFIVAQ